MSKKLKHHPDCNWTKADCSYKNTHHYCPHQEHACNCKELGHDTGSRTIEWLISEIEERRNIAKKNYNQYNKIAHSSYGTGVEWGELCACEAILELISEL